MLVYAFRTGSERHGEFRSWLEGEVGGASTFALSEQVLAGFLRLVTNPRIFAEPTSMSEAVELVDWLLVQPNARIVRPGERHWPIFRGFCLNSGIQGGRVSDAWLAALVLEHGLVWLTADRDFARFPGLVWRHPLDDRQPRQNPN